MRRADVWRRVRAESWRRDTQDQAGGDRQQRRRQRRAARLWGFNDQIAEVSSLRFQRFEEEFHEVSRRLSSDAIGADRFAELVARGRETPWEDLPLVRGEGGVRG